MPKVVYTPVKGLVQEAGTNVGGAMLGFVHDAGSETVTVDDSTISVSTYMTFLKPAAPIDVTLPDGTVVGQLKKLMLTAAAALAHDGGGAVSDVTLAISSPVSVGTNQIVFSVLGDTAELIWNGTAWRILATHNTVTGVDATPVVS